VAAAILSLDPVFLSRIQFGFVISFHIIFPTFTIGLAAWLATLEGMRLATGNAVYRRVFDFWLRVFAVSGRRRPDPPGPSDFHSGGGWSHRSGDGQRYRCAAAQHAEIRFPAN
jgi:hypothetical protein